MAKPVALLYLPNKNEYIPMVKDLYDAYKACTLPHKCAGIYECCFTEGHKEADSRCWITYEFIEKSIKLHEKIKNEPTTV